MYPLTNNEFPKSDCEVKFRIGQFHIVIERHFLLNIEFTRKLAYQKQQNYYLLLFEFSLYGYRDLLVLVGITLTAICLGLVLLGNWPFLLILITFVILMAGMALNLKLK